MNDCCHTGSSSGGPPPKKATCPINGNKYSSVSLVTIKHHITEPWDWDAKSQGYYFCDDPDCDVVYFGEDRSLIYRSDLRTRVGVKEKSVDSDLCYCFGVTFNQANSNNDIKSFIRQETRQHACSCETRNPSGRCCLKDFPKD